MTHTIYLRHQAVAAEARTATNNKIILPVNSQICGRGNQLIPDYKQRFNYANVLLEKVEIKSVSSLVKWSLQTYEPLNELEYE